jgi:hypothetical protein
MAAGLRLSDDHDAVSEVLKQLLAALGNQDVAASYSKLDLLWARLAVHIRAEHLHLFPAVINRLTESPGGVGPELSDARELIEKLRADHDFFMRELARAIGILRELTSTTPRPGDDTKLDAVGNTVRELKERLATHNVIEEHQIYRWSSTILTKAEQLELRGRINAELEVRPPRFSAEAWANCL